MSDRSIAPRPASDTPPCQCGRPDCALLALVEDLRRRLRLLEEQASRDELTGLHNFRHFRELLAQEMSRTQRTGQPTGLMIIDLDHFKQVNDSWGHEVGNRALVHAATVLRDSVRGFDTVCRYGGEEFAVILPGTDHGTAGRVAERLRAVLAATPLQVDGTAMTLTASFGADVHMPGRLEEPREFVARVDRQVYAAKHAGRNCVRIGPSPLRREAAVEAAERDALAALFDDAEPGTPADPG